MSRKRRKTNTVSTVSFSKVRSEHSEQTESRIGSWNFEVPKGMWKAQNLNSIEKMIIDVEGSHGVPETQSDPGMAVSLCISM